jgi:hypothetical protein
MPCGRSVLAGVAGTQCDRQVGVGYRWARHLAEKQSRQRLCLLCKSADIETLNKDILPLVDIGMQHTA